MKILLFVFYRYLIRYRYIYITYQTLAPGYLHLVHWNHFVVLEDFHTLHHLGKLGASTTMMFHSPSEAQWRTENLHQTFLPSPNMSTTVYVHIWKSTVFLYLDSCIIDEEGARMGGAGTQQWRQVSHVSSFIVLMDSIQLATGVVIPQYATGEDDSGPQVNRTCMPDVLKSN